MFEFRVHSGGDAAVAHGMQMYKEAAGNQGNFGWARVVSADGPATIFVAIFHPNFSALDNPGPPPDQVMERVHGRTATQQATAAFADATTLIHSRIWVLRPDLSYTPN